MKRDIASETEMHQLGHDLAQRLKLGDIVELIGDVGAGKTTLTRGIAKGLGIAEPVQSPTFVVQRVYQIPSGGDLVHYDFYRLPDAGILQEELQDRISSSSAIVVIEWGDVVDGVLPEQHIQINIQPIDEMTRQVEIRGFAE